jgi:hypothetical protein
VQGSRPNKTPAIVKDEDKEEDLEEEHLEWELVAAESWSGTTGADAFGGQAEGPKRRLIQSR